MKHLSSIAGDEAVTPNQQTVLGCIQAAINQTGWCTKVEVSVSAKRRWRLTGVQRQQIELRHQGDVAIMHISEFKIRRSPSRTGLAACQFSHKWGSSAGGLQGSDYGGIVVLLGVR